MTKKIDLKEKGNIQSSFEYVMKFDLPKTAKILDIGCNHGSLIKKLYDAGYKNVHGIDVSQENVALGKEVYPELAPRLFSYDGNKLPFEDNEFDIIIMFDVLEHIPDVNGFSREQIYRILGKNSIFIFQTPNKLTNVPWEIFKHRSLTHYKSYHCSLQTLGSLQGMLQNAGFREVRIEKFNILTDYNKKRLKNKVSFLSLPILYTLSAMPLQIFPNFYGYSLK